MNCHDIARLLDHEPPGPLPEDELRRVDAHTAECESCAVQWDVHERVRQEEVPEMPAYLHRWHPDSSIVPAVREPKRRRLRGGLVIPVLILGAAAAAWVAFHSSGSSTIDVESLEPDAGVAGEGPNSVVADEIIDPVEGSAAVARASDEQDEDVASARQRLIVWPVRHESLTALSVQMTEAVHRDLIQFFRSRPELEVIELSETDLAVAEEALAAEPGSEPGSLSTGRSLNIARRFGGDLMAVVRSGDAGPPDRASVEVEFRREGLVATRTEHASASWERFFWIGYAQLLPEAGGPFLESIISDTARTDEARLDALRIVYQMSVMFAENYGNELSLPAFEKAVELGHSAGDPSLRSELWARLAQSGNPALMQPLLDALVADADETVRATAADALAKFRSDPAVSASLVASAGNDPSRDVRLRARWSSLEPEEQVSLVTDALLDASLTVEERVAPLIHARKARFSFSAEDSREVEISALSGDALEELARSFTGNDDPAVRTAALLELGLGGHPQFIALLSVEADETVRRDVRNGLGNRYQRPGVIEHITRQLTDVSPDDPVHELFRSMLSPPDWVQFENFVEIELVPTQ